MSDGPAFYAPRGGLGADAVSLLHPPYTLWHLSYVAIGAAVAPTFSEEVLAWTLLVFFLGLGVAAHALDELNGRPLQTAFSDRALVAIAVAAIAAGGVVVVAGAATRSWWLIAWAAAGLLFAVGYPLERPAVLHTDVGFAVAWGAYPVLAAHWAQAETVSPGVVLVAAAAVMLSMAQRALSTPARFVRRATTGAEAVFDGSKWDRARLLATWEGPLRWLTVFVVALAVGLVVIRW